VVSKEWQQFITSNNYSTKVYPTTEDQPNNLKHWSNLWKIENTFDSQADSSYNTIMVNFFFESFKLAKSRHAPLKEIISSIKPDLIIVDSLISLPAVENSGTPWICLYSANPIRMYYKHCPPADSGFAMDSDRRIWKEYQEKVDQELEPFKLEYEKWLQKHNLELNSNDFLNDSPYLNIYLFPEELDYTDVAPPLKGWFRMDTLIRESKCDDDIVPLEFLSQPGSLIYLSLGSLGGANVDLMKKLIDILNQTEYKVIVSKGPFYDQYELGPRMWGGPFINQLKILPLVDLVITHGGNNTLIESLYFAKPMILFPLFGDQPDTAQRLKEKGLGVRLNPSNFTQSQLLTAIHELMNDDNLKVELQKISVKLQNSKRGDQLIKLLEKVASEKKCPL
jgi:glycosyltransferase, MGT family